MKSNTEYNMTWLLCGYWSEPHLAIFTVMK